MPLLRSVLGALLTGALILGCTVGAADEEESEDVAAGEGEAALNARDLVIEGQLRGDTLPNKTIHLTFDDGPGERTAEVASYLAANDVNATFFINGNRVAGRQGALRAIVDGGHALANHTHEHLLLPKLSASAAMLQIGQTHESLVAAAGPGPFFLRAPYAGWTEPLGRELASSPFASYGKLIHWDVGTKTTARSAADWDCWSKGMAVEACGDLYFAEIEDKGRGIVLLHDLHAKTVAMTKYLVPKLLAAGYRFTSLAEVPSVRAMRESPPAPPKADECFSGTLLRNVPANTCVQVASDRRWARCNAGDWRWSTANDALCASRHPLR